MTTTNAIKNELLANGDGYALDMFSAIEKRAERDETYGASFASWLKSGSTVRLRDLCSPFKDSSIVKNYAPVMPLPFENMFQSIDTARAHLA